MARKHVVKVECSRCDRVEEREPQEGHEPHLTFEAMLVSGPPTDAARDVLLVKWDDLCGPCFSTVKTHLEAIGKKIEGLSPDRVRAKPSKKSDEVDITIDVPEPKVRG